jgi:Pvc16 N-terminal domain
MALNPLGVLDLSVVTDLLIQVLTDCWHNSPIWSTLPPDSYFFPSISGYTPERARLESGPQLSISLIHIEPNKYQRNFVFPPNAPPPPQPPSPQAQLIPALPLSLELFFFVTAFSENSYHQEQQMMSVVLRTFHEHPIIRTNVFFPGSPGDSTQEEFTLTMEIESADSISRLWQAITAPFRLSLMYRVGVVLITPPEPPAGAPQVLQYTVATGPTTLKFAVTGQVFGTSSLASYLSPDSTPAQPQTLRVRYSPATVVPGQRFYLFGSGLNQGTDYTGAAPNPGTSYRVFLLTGPNYTAETEVTAWKTADPSPQDPIQTPDRFALDFPNAATPAAGVYMLRAGSNSPPDANTNRTNATPFSVAARVDVPGAPPNPILPPAAGIYSVGGQGFIAGSTEVLLDTVPLTYSATLPLAAGQFNVANATSMTFSRPATMPPGRYTVRVRVNQVESPPALWIQV